MSALDASALLAFLFSEQGYEQVETTLNESCISSVNLSEVIGRFVRDGYDARLAAGKLNQLPIQVVPFSSHQAELAAQLLPQTKPFGLSLGDRACLALAIDLNIVALTADRVWLNIEAGVEIESIR